jgi:hypothetical protein
MHAQHHGIEQGAAPMNLDTEYVWEGGEDIFEDIVASTH